jgi:hypothetical protein
VSEDRRLRDKLAKLAAEEAAGGPRRLSAAPGSDLTRAILEEIDETILARTITFRSDGGAVLALEVANRRLLGLAEASPDAVAPADRARLLAPLPADDDEALAAVAHVLRHFAEGQPGLAVSSVPLGRPVGSGMLGRSGAAVARALGLDLYDRPVAPVVPDPARGFDAGLARLSFAVATVSDGTATPATGPDADAVGRLSLLEADLVARLDAEIEPAGGFVIFSGADEALFYGRKADGRAIAALLAVDHAGAVAALWQATGGA